MAAEINAAVPNDAPRGRGRPRKGGDLVRNGLEVRFRLPRTVHEQAQDAAAEDGLAIRQWIRRVICVELRRVRRGKAGS